MIVYLVIGVVVAAILVATTLLIKNKKKEVGDMWVSFSHQKGSEKPPLLPKDKKHHRFN